MTPDGARCSFVKADGTRCAMRPTASGTCVVHDETQKAAMQEARRRGAEAARARRAAVRAEAAQGPSVAPTKALKLDTAGQIHSCLEETVNAVRLGNLSATAANVIGSLCRAALTALEVRLLEQLEAEKAQQEASQPVGARRRRR